MSFKKFTENDVFSNTMLSYPKVNFFVSEGKIYYNSIPEQSGSRNAQVRNVPVGSISLYEFNIDRPYVAAGATGTTGKTTRVPLSGGAVIENGRIAPWISKDSARSSFKTVFSFAASDTSYNSEFAYGDILQGQYPLSASITREFITGSRPTSATIEESGYPFNKAQRHYVALRNRLDFYALRSLHYKVSSSYGNKDQQKLNMISVPSIFYGTKIKPGSVSLKWNFTGSAIAELRDLRENGELIQVSGAISANDGKIAGVVMYDEGVVILTGSWDLSATSLTLSTGSPSSVKPSWLYFGVGAGDGLSQSNLAANFVSASYDINFKGYTETQVVTMFAHARKGEANYSNNPTFLEHGQTHTEYTSSHVYEERPDVRIKNIVSSSYSDHSASFKRSVYVSRVGIYDKNKNLIGVASVSNPILKQEDQDYSFKLKLDI